VGNGLPFQKAKIYKVDMHYLEKKFFASTSCWISNTQLVRDDQQIQNYACMHLCYGVYIDILFIAMVIYFLYICQVIV